jgi:hypothetical protein
LVEADSMEPTPPLHLDEDDPALWLAPLLAGVAQRAGAHLSDQAAAAAGSLRFAFIATNAQLRRRTLDPTGIQTTILKVAQRTIAALEGSTSDSHDAGELAVLLCEEVITQLAQRRSITDAASSLAASADADGGTTDADAGKEEAASVIDDAIKEDAAATEQGRAEAMAEASFKAAQRRAADLALSTLTNGGGEVWRKNWTARWVPGRAGQGYAKERKKRPKVRAHESDEEDEGEEEEEAEIESGRGGGGKAPKARGKGPLGKILARIGGDIEYKCGRCGGVVRERTWKSHREKKKACLAANAGEMLFRVKLEAPPPAPPRTAQTFSGAPFVHTPKAPGPATLPKAKAEPKAKKPRRNSAQASIARMAAAARERREARETAESASPEPGSSSSGAAAGEASEGDEVEFMGARSREERDAELRQQAVDVDAVVTDRA